MKNARPTEVKASALSQRSHSTAVVECNGALFVETTHVSALFDRPHRNIMRDVDRLVAGGASVLAYAGLAFAPVKACTSPTYGARMSVRYSAPACLLLLSVVGAT